MGRREAQVAHPCTRHDECGCAQSGCCLDCPLVDCDPQNHEGIVRQARALRDTVPVPVLAKRFGIHKATLWRWLEEGDLQERGRLWDFLRQVSERLERLEERVGAS